MASTSEGRYPRFLRHALPWVVGSGVVAAAAIGAMLLSGGQAAAQPLDIPGVGTFEVPVEFSLPVAIPGIELPRSAEAPEASGADEYFAPELPVLAEIPTVEFSTPAMEFSAPVETLAIKGHELAPTSEVALAGAEPAPSFAVPGTELSMPAAMPAPMLAFPADLLHIDLPFLSGALGIRPPAPEPMRTAPPKTHGELAVEAAQAKVGTGYSMGAAGPDAFDCSGLVQWSYGEAGVDVPRTSYDQLAAGTPVSQDELEPGDLVSFYGGGHSALYAGDGKVIHASTYGTGVTTSSMSSMPFAGARRF